MPSQSSQHFGPSRKFDCILKGNGGAEEVNMVYPIKTLASETGAGIIEIYTNLQSSIIFSLNASHFQGSV